MSDNFLQQIQSTETQAQKMIHDAELKAEKELDETKKQYELNRKKKLEEAKAKAKQKILAKQTEMKKIYTDEIEKEKRNIEQKKRQTQEKQSSVLSSAQVYFINNLL